MRIIRARRPRIGFNIIDRRVRQKRRARPTSNIRTEAIKLIIETLGAFSSKSKERPKKTKLVDISTLARVKSGEK